jgi:hypothetical protein
MALELLAFIARDEVALGRFVAETGLSPDTIAAQVQDPTFLAGVMDFVLGDESLLLAYAANAGIDPHAVLRARSKLPGYSY